MAGTKSVYGEIHTRFFCARRCQIWIPSNTKFPQHFFSKKFSISSQIFKILFQKSGEMTPARYLIYRTLKKSRGARALFPSLRVNRARPKIPQGFRHTFFQKKFFWEVITIPIRIISPGSQRRPLSWGLQGEHNATQLQLDVRQFLAAWPDGTPALMITR